jgi:hypothetical protein
VSGRNPRPGASQFIIEGRAEVECWGLLAEDSIRRIQYRVGGRPWIEVVVFWAVLKQVKNKPSGESKFKNRSSKCQVKLETLSGVGLIVAGTEIARIKFNDRHKELKRSTTPKDVSPVIGPALQPMRVPSITQQQNRAFPGS